MTTTDKIKLAALALLALVIIGGVGWLWAHKKEPVAFVPPVPTTIVQPQVIHTNTETIRTVAVESAPKGNIMQFTEREGKQYMVVEGKEYQLASQTGPAQIKVGENGQIVMATETTAKLDVTQMVQAQVNDKLAIQGAAMKAEQDKKLSEMRRARTVGYVVGGAIITGLGYAAIKK